MAKRTAREKVSDPVSCPEHPFPARIIANGGKQAAAYRMQGCSIFVAREPIEIRGIVQLRWHMSIANPKRYPTWDEIAHAREKLLPRDLCFAMFLPSEREGYINTHPNCFHLWETHDA